MGRRLFLFLLLVFAAANCVRIGSARGPKERAAFNKFDTPPLSLWSDRSINAAMLGHRSLYDDFLSIWLVQLLADENLPTYADVDQTYKIITTVTRLHPKIESIYLFSCFVLALDFNRPDLCEPISLDGLKAFPESWRIPMTQGFIAAFKLGDYARAAGYYSIASTRSTSPEWVKSLAQKLVDKGQATGQDFNETVSLLKEVPGGTRLIELMRPRMRDQIPVPFAMPPSLNASPQPSSSPTAENQGG